MAVHTDKHNLSADEMSKLWCDLREETSLVTIGNQVVGGQSGFAHITGMSPLRCHAVVREGGTDEIPFASAGGYSAGKSLTGDLDSSRSICSLSLFSPALSLLSRQATTVGHLFPPICWQQDSLMIPCYRLPLLASLLDRHVQDRLREGPDGQGGRSAVPSRDLAARRQSVRRGGSAAERLTMY